MLIKEQVKPRKVQLHVSQLCCKYEWMFNRAQSWDELRTACIALCRNAKSYQVVEMLYESLYRWMESKKRAIPYYILQSIHDAVSGFKKLHGQRLFTRETGFVIHDPAFSLNPSKK